MFPHAQINLSGGTVNVTGGTLHADNVVGINSGINTYNGGSAILAAKKAELERLVMSSEELSPETKVVVYNLIDKTL